MDFQKVNKQLKKKRTYKILYFQPSYFLILKMTSEASSS